MKFIDLKPHDIIPLKNDGLFNDAAHVFDKDQIDAINAAIGAGRPLLIKGETGCGKSQLAQAAAQALGWAYLPYVANSHTESRDLLWSFDAVARLADAQVFKGCTDDQKTLLVENYIKPGVLWWAFDWGSAKKQAIKSNVPLPPDHETGKYKKGCVVLIDEIDKTDSDVPNGLLEAFGAGQFPVRGCSEPVKISDIAMLVIITTNNERALPDAFLRRCLVLNMTLSTDVEKATASFVEIGKAHFKEEFDESFLEKAARKVAEDRQKAHQEHAYPLPGKAEYIDLLRSIHNQHQHQHKNRDKEGGPDKDELLEIVSQFVLNKNAEQ